MKRVGFGLRGVFIDSGVVGGTIRRNHAHQFGFTRTGLESTCKLRRPNYLSSPAFYYNHSIFRIG